MMAHDIPTHWQPFVTELRAGLAAQGIDLRQEEIRFYPEEDCEHVGGQIEIMHGTRFVHREEGVLYIDHGVDEGDPDVGLDSCYGPADEPQRVADVASIVQIVAEDYRTLEREAEALLEGRGYADRVVQLKQADGERERHGL